MKLYFIPIIIILLISLTACTSNKYSEKNIPDVPSYCENMVFERDVVSEAKQIGVILRPYTCVDQGFKVSIIMSIFKSNKKLLEMNTIGKNYNIVDKMPIGGKISNNSQILNKYKKSCGEAEIYFYSLNNTRTEQQSTPSGEILYPGNYIFSELEYVDDNLILNIGSTRDSIDLNNESGPERIFREMGFSC